MSVQFSYVALYAPLPSVVAAGSRLRRRRFSRRAISTATLMLIRRRMALGSWTINTDLT